LHQNKYCFSDENSIFNKSDLDEQQNEMSLALKSKIELILIMELKIFQFHHYNQKKLIQLLLLKILIFNLIISN
jgi:hypothetical protein